MKKMKKLSAALLAVVMLVSMLSCMVLGTSAATTDLSGPATIEKIVTGGVTTGIELPNNVLIVNSDWADKAVNATVSLKLNGIARKGTFGVNAFADLCDAVAVAKSNDTIYVAPGVYAGDLEMPAITNLKIYGPWAGVTPNDPNAQSSEDLVNANTARPGASITDYLEASKTEAVYTGTIKMIFTANNPDEHLTVDGLYFGLQAYFTLNNGGTYRIGTYVRNCVVNVTSGDFFSMNRGMNPGFEFENNRVLKATRLQQVGGFMGGTYKNNYFNLSDYMLHPSSVQNGGVGTVALIEGNYFENCAGIVTYGSNNYQTVLYSLVLKNNTINNVKAGKFLIYNEYDSFHSMPGITITVTGNKVLNIPAETTLFQFPTRESEHSLTRIKYIVNINDNEFNLPKNQTLVSSAMAGTINLMRNTFTNGIAMNQIKHADDCEVNLYPSYTLDADGNKVVLGDAKILKFYGEPVTEEQEENKYLELNLGNFSEDTLELSDYLELSDGCDFELYEEATLATKVEDKKVYFDAYVTDRYIRVLYNGGVNSSVYRLHITRNYNKEAKLLNVQESNPQVEVTQDGDVFTVNMDKNVITLDYQLKVSSGATYELYSDAAFTKPLAADESNYIPYGVNGNYYTIYVKVIAEDSAVGAGYYTVVFKRERSTYYDPSVTGLKDGKVYILIDRLEQDKLYVMYNAGETLLDKTAFDFTTTPGAKYTVYQDSELKTALSSSDSVKELPLTDGLNTFYIKVEDSNYTNVMTFVVRNGTLSDDTRITGLVGQSPVIIDNVITLTTGGTSFTGTFTTGSEYAVCDVYADAEHKIKIAANSAPVIDPDTNRIIDQRSFTLATEHNSNKYYVVCTAENGDTENYTLILNKIIAELTYADVPASEWYAEAIQAASNAGYLNGETAGETTTFRPNDGTTREEMATIIARLLGINGEAYKDVKLGYKDEASISSWALNNVRVAKYYGIMTGSKDADGLYFYPGSTITREETMKVFVNLLGVKEGKADLSKFKDANKISSWAVEYAEAAVASGIFAGDDKGNLNPGANINRAEIATIITRVMDRI